MENQSVETTVKPWEREVIEKMLFESLKEQKRARRWRIFFRLFFLLLILLIIYFIFSSTTTVIKPHTALIRIQGTIMEDSKASAENIIKGLTNAFEDTNTKGIVLKINSPGGSPVQANTVYEEIIRLKKKYPNTKVYAVCSDVCASGAYYIAAAANEIYADPASIVGSIGVVMEGFGFVDTLEKVGASRRIFTAGTEKGFMDPFSPLKEQNVAHLQTMLNTIHGQFITAVKQGRGSRLQNNLEIYSGLVWTGQQAKGIGLIDGFGTAEFVANNIIKESEIIDYTAFGDIFQRFTEGFTSQFSRSIGSLLGIHPSSLH